MLGFVTIDIVYTKMGTGMGVNSSYKCQEQLVVLGLWFLEGSYIYWIS